MNCPKCHGTGYIVVEIGWGWTGGIGRHKETERFPCDHPGCRAGQISCAEVENRNEAPAA